MGCKVLRVAQEGAEKAACDTDLYGCVLWNDVGGHCGMHQATVLLPPRAVADEAREPVDLGPGREMVACEHGRPLTQLETIQRRVYAQLSHHQRWTVRVVCGSLVKQVASSLQRAKNDDVLAEQVEIHHVAWWNTIEMQ